MGIHERGQLMRRLKLQALLTLDLIIFVYLVLYVNGLVPHNSLIDWLIVGAEKGSNF